MKSISPSRIIQTAIADAIGSIFAINIEPSKILLEIGYPRYDAHYTSTIAFAIANLVKLHPFKIAEAIAKSFSQNPAISSRCQIQALGKGWLNIKLSQQYIIESLLDLNKWQIDGFTNHDGLWQRQDISSIVDRHLPNQTLQYAYARCCALIRLANQIIDVRAIHELPLHQLSDFINYLETAEISLLMQNLEISAYLESEAFLNIDQSRNKLSRSLAEAFLDFYDRCRIFGVSREIALRRILLITITQKLLLAIAPLEINYAMYL